MEIAWISSNILMYWGVCYILLMTCTSPFQSAFDEYTERFSTIIDHAEQVLKYGAERSTGQQALMFETGVIPPLYFCTTKCRDPLLRRRALRLMRGISPRDSLWASLATEQVIERIISIEEGHELGLPVGVAASSRILPLPPEEHRIMHIAIVGKDMRGERPRLTLQLSKFAFSPDGSRKIVHENIWLESLVHGKATPDHPTN